MTNHISNVCRCSHFHIRILRHIRRTLTNNMANYRRYMILLSTQVVYFKSGLSNILSHTASQKFKCYHHWLMPITCHFRESDSFRFKNAVTLRGGYLRGDFSRRVLTAMFPGSYFLASSLYAEHSKKTH